MKIIPIPAPADDALEPWVPFPSGDATDVLGSATLAGANQHGFIFSEDGWLAFVMIEPAYIRTYALTAPFECSGWTEIDDRSFGSLSNPGEDSYGLAMNQKFSWDGMKYYIIYWGSVGHVATICQWDLNAPYDFSGRNEYNYDTSFRFPQIIMGYDHEYLREFDISEDGQRLYVQDKGTRKLGGNPDGAFGVIYEYEMTTPYDLSTLVELGTYALRGQDWGGAVTSWGFTVYTRGHHVDQVIESGAYLNSFLYDGVLEDRFERDVVPGGVYNPSLNDYVTYIMHRRVRGMLASVRYYNNDLSFRAQTVAEV